MQTTFTPQSLTLLTARTDGTTARAGMSTQGGERREAGDLVQMARQVDKVEKAESQARSKAADEDHIRGRRSDGETRRLKARMEHLGRALSRLLAGRGEGGKRPVLVAGGFIAGGGVALTISANRIEGLFTDFKAGLSQHLTYDDAQWADAITLSADTVRMVDTAGGNDALAIETRIVEAIYTGNDSDAVAIRADVVRGVSTDVGDDPSVPGGVLRAGADAVSIVAGLVEAVSTGGGNDAIAVQADLVRGIAAGAGDDAVTVHAGLVAGIDGGDGNDRIIVDAVIGQDGRSDPPKWRSLAEMGVAARMAEVSDRGTQVGGGAGADLLSVRAAEGLGVAGGSGDDLIVVAGGTVAIGYSGGDGNDRVALAAGAEAVLQLGYGVTDYTVTTDGDAMVVTLGSGSVRFEGVGGSGAIGIRTWQGEVELLHQGAATALDRLV